MDVPVKVQGEQRYLNGERTAGEVMEMFRLAGYRLMCNADGGLEAKPVEHA